MPSATEPGGTTGGRRWRDALKAAVRFSVLLDLVVIVGVAILFARPILNFDKALIPSAFDDWEAATSSLFLVRDSILHHAEFPLWNPFFRTGNPYLGDPNANLLNPLASVPSLVMGVFNGSKVSAALSIAVAGLAMYVLAWVAGVSRPFRIWAGLALAMSGGIAARILAGHFNFVVSLPLVPLVFALELQALRKRGVAYPMLAGIANALLFFSGEVYYAVYAAPGLILTFLLVLVAEGWHKGDWSLRRGGPVLLRGVAVAGWTFGFAAVQLLPYLESRSALSLPSYDLSGSQTLLASVGDFFQADREQLIASLPGPWSWWEYYSYVGYVPLIGAPLALLALWRPERRFVVIWAASLFGLYLAWAAGSHSFVKIVYEIVPSLHHFRVPSRALGFAAPFFILLAALGFEEVLAWARRQRLSWRLLRPGQRLKSYLAIAGPIGVLALLAVCSYGLRDAFDVNQKLLESRPRVKDRSLEAQVLRSRDSSVFYVYDPTQGLGMSPEFYEAGIKRLDAFWPYSFNRILPKAEPGAVAPSITVSAKYTTGAPGGSAQPIYSASRIGLNVATDSPYYAATLRSADPPIDASYAWRSKTHEATARVVSANVIEVAADPPGGDDRLLVLESFFPGWRLEVDGHRTGGPDNYGGFLSTAALKGEHTYTFVYDPRSFRYGAAVTVGTMLGGGLLLLSRFASRLRRRHSQPTAPA